MIKGAVLFQVIVWLAPPVHTLQGAQEDEEPRFIPFPLTTTRLPGRRFRASDPEWAEFLRISKDEKAQREIRRAFPSPVCGTSHPRPES